MLNAEQIIEKGLLKLGKTHGKPAQVGYDLSVKEIKKIYNTSAEVRDDKIGKVFKDRTELSTYTHVNLITLGEVKGWILHPGAYEFTFWEGCTIPANYVGRIVQRSSLLRNGAIINSSIFDPGFETEHMGTICIVNVPIFIEQNARVAQMYFHQTEDVAAENLYNGQWQNDKQR